MVKEFKESTPGRTSLVPEDRVDSERHRLFDGVELRRLTNDERVAYASSTSSTMSTLEIVGEYEEGGETVFFARTKDNLARRYTKEYLVANHNDILSAYKRKRAAGKLPPFDPSGPDIHPKSRVRMVITINKSLAARPPVSTTPSDGDTQPDESYAGSDDEAEDAAESSEEEWANDPTEGTPPRRSERNKVVKNLPFSPKKTRFRKTFFVGEDGEDEDDSSSAVPTRRNPRRTRATSASPDAEDEYRVSDDQEEDRPKRKGKGKTKRHSRSSASSGPVHAAEDFDYDSDEDTAPLRAHRHSCERCGERPSHLLKKKTRRRKNRDEDDEFEDEGGLGGWLKCTRCPVAMHWGCLSATRQNDILRSVHQQEVAAWQSTQSSGQGGSSTSPPKRDSIEATETTGFLCNWCSSSRADACLGCDELLPKSEPPTTTEESGLELLFRCVTCTRACHYAHLHPPSDDESYDAVALAVHYQTENLWKCADCASFVYKVDKIIAWRPSPASATEPVYGPLQTPDYTQPLPREYLVKWQDRAYKRVSWVPHMWLLATNKLRLRKFVAEGRTVKLLDHSRPDESLDATGDVDTAMDVDPPQPQDEDEMFSVTKRAALLAPVPDAERRIPAGWLTVDRVLSILLLRDPAKGKRAKKVAKRTKNKTRVDSEDDDDDDDADALSPEVVADREDAYDHGEQPRDDFTLDLEQWEKRTKQKLSVDEIDDVIWCLIKWEDLGYDETTWDAPPRRGEPGFAAFERAFQRYVASREIEKPKGPSLKKRPRNGFKTQGHFFKDGTQPVLGQSSSFKLMDYQVDGLNWLCHNWWNLQHCILADEMGLGKTVQIATFLGTIISKWNAYPALVVVPNSTIGNWVRELERWAPNLRVVPFFGDARARSCIIDYELRSFHVLVTSYEAFSQGTDFTRVFKNEPRWEVLVVDEGQRLKNNDSLTFKKLNEVNSIHRIIMTGTPLNNNIRELFNLMNFLDPEEWADLEALEKEHEVLDEDLIKQLHERLRPYFLRRTKKEVLKLPPKNEVIVPLSMAALQKQVYKSILSGNFEVLKRLNTTNTRGAASLANLKNMLMQLRKCLQHPYLVSPEIEPKGLSQKEAHTKLIEASTKLLFLKALLPQLKERGHRVLLFSQFMIALNVIEDFLADEGIKYLRLDGSTPQRARQEGIDEFNREGSDVFIYLLTTRAGGAGINLWTADTVIVFDPDFNPHQDLQAIARSHRYGQKKTVLVFKLMVKDSAEERIMQTGKKKLVLDHLIVQKMDDDEPSGDNVQSILTYGAQALFNEDGEQTSRDITYSETDIRNLIEKTENAQEDEEDKEGGGFSFSFAKVWATDKDAMEELPEDGIAPVESADSWAATLARIEADRAKLQAEETNGRGARRRKAAKAYTADEAHRTNGKGRQAFEEEDGVSEFTGSDGGSSSDSSAGFQEPVSHRKKVELCGLCDTMHEVGAVCSMTQSSDHLAMFRMQLLTSDEPWQERKDAILAIEETLHRRGDIEKIMGQPLHLLEPGSAAVAPKPPRKRKKLSAKTVALPTSSPVPDDKPVAGPSVAARPPGPARASDGKPVMTKNGVPTHLSAAGILKRASAAGSGAASPSTAGTPTGKSAKAAREAVFAQAQQCNVCGVIPFHHPRTCPEVQKGTKHIARQIERLDKLGGKLAPATAVELRKILSKLKRQEMEQAATSELPADAMQVD